MSIIKYSFASLSGAAEDIETSSRTIQGQLEDLKAQIKRWCLPGKVTPL